MSELEARRAHECRLAPDRALQTLDEAADWVRERGLVTALPTGSLPSLHVAVHEEPYKPGSRGFGLYPRTTWWWSFDLATRPEFLWLKILRGKGVLLHERAAPAVDPLARRELTRAGAGEHGEDARRLAEHLAAAGPSHVDDLKVELGLGTKALRAARAKLERVAAIVKTEDGLQRWDQLRPEPVPGGLDELLVAAVRAAVLAPEDEARRWFSWPVSRAEVEALVEAGRLRREGSSLTGDS